MAIPATFTFSQSSLKDYHDCPRRFQLRYLERLAWPAPQSADALECERRLRLGQEFHRLVRQHQAGVPASALTPLAGGDPELARRWAGYLASPYASPPGLVRRAELILSAPLAGYRLEAQYDLLAGTPGGAWLIVDWKTGLERTPRQELERREQTVVYRCLLALAGATLNGGQPIPPQQITMVYWFAAGHRAPEIFAYDAARYDLDLRTLRGWVTEIAARPEGTWPMSTASCPACVYRSFCAQEVPALPPDELEASGEMEDWLPDSLDLLEEIAF